MFKHTIRTMLCSQPLDLSRRQPGLLCYFEMRQDIFRGADESVIHRVNCGSSSESCMVATRS